MPKRTPPKKRGPGRPEIANPKSRIVNFRVTDADWNRLVAIAKKYHVPTAPREAAREILLNYLREYGK